MLRKEIGDNLYETTIRVNTKAKAAPSVHKTIFEYEGSASGRGTEDFTKLTEEFLARLEMAQGQTRKVANG
jgi:cellulose biosynthesis protein BcsQ